MARWASEGWRCALLLFWLASCADVDPSTPPDAGRSDAGRSDALPDAGLPDARPSDAMPPDAPHDASSHAPERDGATAHDDAAMEGGSVTSPEGPGSCLGYATRYWDCCKAHCGWAGNVPESVAPATSCGLDDTPLASFDTPSSCDGSGGAFTCFSMAPRAISESLSYGFAAVPAMGDVCGRCYRIDFTGEGHYDVADPGSRALAGRTMIVQATNIGHDVGGGQFDLLIPGGGVGLFNACSRQWGVSDAELGAQYGGLLTACRASHSDHEAVRGCVRDRCHAIFDDARFAELRAGCDWFVDWFHAADNPNLTFREVACPSDLVATSSVDRRPLDDVAESCGGTEPGTCECDCGWTAGGAACGSDDGSCCWRVCCGS